MKVPGFIEEIKTIWNKLPIPSQSDLGLQSNLVADELYHKDILVLEKWLLGKKYDEIHSDGYDEVECPLLYLSGIASRYYLGGYLIKLAKDIDGLKSKNSYAPSFSTIHLVEYLGSSKFVIDIRDADITFQKKVSKYIRILSENADGLSIFDS